MQRRATRLYQQLDDLRPLHREARQELLAESRKHPASTLLRQIPWLGPIRVALLIAFLQTPYRFRTKRQLWAYSGLALRTCVSGEYRSAGGQLQRAKRPPTLRGLNENHNHELKALIQEHSHAGQCGCRLVRGVLCGPVGHGDEAHHGSFDRSPARSRPSF